MTYVFKTGPMYKSANQDDSIQFYYGIEFHFVDLLIRYIVFPKHVFCHPRNEFARVKGASEEKNMRM